MNWVRGRNGKVNFFTEYQNSIRLRFRNIFLILFYFTTCFFLYWIFNYFLTFLLVIFFAWKSTNCLERSSEKIFYWPSILVVHLVPQFIIYACDLLNHSAYDPHIPPYIIRIWDIEHLPRVFWNRKKSINFGFPSFTIVGGIERRCNHFFVSCLIWLFLFGTVISNSYISCHREMQFSQRLPTPLHKRSTTMTASTLNSRVNIWIRLWQKMGGWIHSHCFCTKHLLYVYSFEWLPLQGN